MLIRRSRPWTSIALLVLLVALVASTGIASPDEPKTPTKPAVVTKESQAAMTPGKALDTLKEGNKRFRTGASVKRDLPAKVKATAEEQHPFAVILSCMDSRVPAEMVFDQSIGSLFSIRVAGNVVNPDNLGSVEYAAKVMGSMVIVVLGHTSCGAVKGAIDDVKLGNLTELLAKIRPAVAASGPGTSKDHAYVDKVGEQNVRVAMKEIREKSPILKGLIDSGAIGLVGGMYDLGTGAVTFFQD